MMRPTKYWLIAASLVGIVCISGRPCPDLHYGPGCQTECNCTQVGTESCDRETGSCHCKPGFTGPLCEPIVDPCANQTVCKERFQYCNPINSTDFECLCSSGYVRTPSEKCYPCPEDTAGANCGTGCDCHAANTAGCLSEVGTCICMYGWEGPRCEQSVDDCVGSPCAPLTCVDEHRGFVCYCEKGRFVRGRAGMFCADYEVVILVSDDRPMVGDTISLYLVYSLAEEYKAAPLLQLDFNYQLYVNEVEACKMSFHSSFIRISGNEHFLKKLSPSEKEFQFYSHYQVHMKQAGTVTLRAAPTSSDYTELIYVIPNVRPRPDDLTKCFSRMAISGTLRCPEYDASCSGVNLHKNQRQSFHIFRVTNVPWKVCKTNPMYTWAFYKFHKADRKKAGHCYEAANKQLLNIDRLIAASGQPIITDHDDVVEIVPKNTLPLGPILICVTGHLRGVTMFSTTYCGVIEVVPSYKIVPVGIRPNLDYHIVKNDDDDEPYRFLPGYREPDLNLPLEYKCERNPRRSGDFYEHTDTGYLYWKYLTRRYTISLKKDPRVKLVEQIRTQYYTSSYDYKKNYRLGCFAGCGVGSVVGTSQDFILSAVEQSSDFSTRHKKEITPTYTWTLSENNVIRNSFLTFGSQIFDVMIKANTLKPGNSYTVIFSSTRYPDFRLRFISAAAPRQGRCSIDPKIGTVMVSKFTVFCQDYKAQSPDPIRYHLYLRHSIGGMSEKFFTLIAYGGDSALKNLRFSTAGSSNFSKVHLQIRVVSIVGSPTISELHVQIKKPVDMINLDEVLRVLSDSWWSRSLQENVRYLYNLATRISGERNADMKKKILVTNKILEHLGNHEGETAEWIEHTAMALERVTSQAEQIRPSGLEAGLVTAERLAKHLARTRRYNFDTLFRVSRILLFALDHLVHASALLGKKTLMYEYKKPADQAAVIEQMRKYAQQSVNTILKISDDLAKHLVGRERELYIKAPHIHMGIHNTIVRKDKGIELGKNRSASFYMGAEDANVNLGGGLVTQFQSFDKNPYAFDTENTHGDLPLIKVEFSRMIFTGVNERWNGFQPNTGPNKAFKFKEPAHVFLLFKNTGGEVLPYSAIIDVETRNTQHVVVKSSCLFFSVPASTHRATVLEVRSKDGVTLKAKFAYTNNLSAIDDVGVEGAFEIPLREVKPLQTPMGLLYRDPYLLYLPKLSEKAKKESVEFYRLAISVKLGQPVDVNRLNPVKSQERNRSSDSNLGQLAAYNTSISITPYRMACKHFDDKVGRFLSKECSLTMYSNTTLLHCLCANAGAYSGSFLAVPRIIEKISSSLFLYFFHNPIPVSLMIATWMVFLAAVIWARDKDRQDVGSCRPSVLGEHWDKDSYLYLICVNTGWSVRAATTSIVYLYIIGSWGRSETFSLCDSTKHLFKSGAHDWFLLATEDDLGEIRKIAVWTSFSGEMPSWFLYSVVIKNLQTKETWTCYHNSWLSFVFGSKQVFAVVRAHKDKDEEMKKRVKLRSQVKSDMRNDHLWLGVFAKSPSNHFTRVRRLVTALTMLQVLMFLNFIFTGTSFIVDGSYHMVVFGHTVYLTSVLFSLLNAFITTVLGTGLAYVFNRTADRPVAQKDGELPEEQRDVMSRREDLRKRRQAGLWKLYPPLQGETDIDVSTSLSILSTLSINDSSTQSHFLDTGKGKTADKKAPRLTCFPDSPTHFLMPWWTLYMTWIAVAAINIIITYHLMLKGLSLSYGESLQWFVLVVIGFLVDLLIFTPAKVAVTTTVKALWLHERSYKKEKPPISSLEQAQKLMAKEKVLSRYTSGLFRRRAKRFPRPINITDGRKILDILKIRRVARTMLRDLFLYTIFTGAVLVVIRAHLDVEAEYLQTANVEMQLLGMKMDQDLGTPVLPEIHDTKDVWDYLIGVSTKRLVLDVDFQDKNISHTYYMVTHARLRQVRTVSTADTFRCPEAIPHRIWPRNNSHECLPWGEFPEEMGNFTEGWVRPMIKIANGTFDSSDFIEDSAYRYWTARDLNTAAYVGDHGWYSGGGYVIDYFREDPNAVADALKKLEREKWIDRLTRCVFLEFTVYNYDIDMFTQVILAFEMDRFGGVIPTETIHTANLSYKERNKSVWLKLAQGIAALCVLFYTLVSIKFILYHGLPAFIAEFWNWVEVLVLLLSVLCVLLYSVRLEKYTALMNDFKRYGNSKFLDFSEVFKWQIVFHHTVGFYGALVIFKMVKVTTFNPFTKTFIQTLVIGLDDFLAFLLATVIIMAAFGMLGQFTFGANTANFSSFSRTQYSLLFFILGEPDFPAIVVVNSFMARFFFIGFLFCSQYLVINLFISILRDSLEIARLMSYREEKAVIRHMVESILFYFNISGWRERRKKRTLESA